MPLVPKAGSLIVVERSDTQLVPSILVVPSSFPVLLNHFDSVHDIAITSRSIDAESTCLMWRSMSVAHVPQLSDAIADFVRDTKVSTSGRLIDSVERPSLASGWSSLMPVGHCLWTALK